MIYTRSAKTECASRCGDERSSFRLPLLVTMCDNPALFQTGTNCLQTIMMNGDRGIT